ncbi:DedA family protein [Candidatus Peregrinibacteria bacterium]|nr:DedA family protein [Candidatus Peregrinibacteria bacterium]MBI3816398.1 DedA family protein [Candidatus Peregrinibacteria bacterium]
MVLLDLFLHLDAHLQNVILQYGTLTYALLFMIIFCETGLVVTPFLPGDSLLFAAGAFAAKGSFHPLLLFAVLSLAAIIGDSVNYAIGKAIGPRVFTADHRYLRKEHLLRAHAFYERHGGKAIVFARFVPIIRTLAPFVAGVGSMEYKRFLMFNVTGGIAWVALFVFSGYFFGTIPAVAHNFTLVIFGIIIISILPGVAQWGRGRMRAKVGRE